MRLLLTLWLCVWQLLVPAQAQDVLPVPVLTARLIDQTGTLDALQRSALEGKLEAFEREAGPQIVILMLPSTAPEDITSYAQRVADSWKIGRREVGDGLLIVVAKNDRKVRIEVAKALEGAIPDLAARQIIQNAISPAFKAGDYAGGLNQAVDQLQARIRGEALPAPSKRTQQARDSGFGFGFEELAGLFFIGVPVLGAILTGIFGRKLGSVATGGAAGAIGWFFSASALIAGLAGVAALVLVGIMGVGAARRGSRIGSGHHGSPVIWGGGGGGWGGGDGGGGFSSGGGGDFGGGGASGDW
ncbi:MAG: hypothetical protein C0423_19915 [Methylibium sp.]|nr:hypothetical protein [Methylibium sp.]